MLNRYQGNTGNVRRIDDSALRQKPSRADAVPIQKAQSEKNIFEKLSVLLPGTGERLDSEDIILLLILYLMYRESGDTELLIIMGAVFLL